MKRARPFLLLLPGVFLLTLLSAAPQETAAPALNESAVTDYPKNKAGVLMADSDWNAMQPETPAKFHLKNGIAPILTYGIAPAKGVSEYAGAHAATSAETGQLTICICHVLSIPGEPVLVRLHPTKKNIRELDAGKIHIGGKLAKAESEDLIATDVAHPEDTVWVVRPRTTLPPGEYALMLGTQNMSIYSFTVGAPGAAPRP